MVAVLVSSACGTNHDSNPQLTDLDISGASLRLGGLLWDQWWTVDGGTEPATTFPLYSKTAGTQSGATTWRCQECHGWDYLGAAGAYATGPHHTAVAGVIDRVANRTNQELFDIIKSGTAPASGGSALTGTDHAFSGVLDDAEVSDLVRFLRDGLVDTRTVIAPDGDALGNAGAGAPLYSSTSSDPAANVGECVLCHGSKGKALGLGDPSGSATLGAVAREQPWRALHRMRWGAPGSSMTSAVELGLSLEQQSDVLAYSQTLPND